MIVVIAAAAAFGQPSRTAAPRFEDYRVPTPIPARKARAEVANHAPDFEKQIAQSAKEGPDFAGHFVVEQWTCGSLCTEFVIVNIKTLEIHRPKFSVSYMCPAVESEGELSYRLDSRLLVVNGAIETHNSKGEQIDGPCGKFYYEWDGRALKVIQFGPTARSKSPNVPQ
jgi:hypothetical protein